MNIKDYTGSGFEKLIEDIGNAGEAWVEAKLRADLIEEDVKPYLAALMNELEGSLSESARDRMARGSKGYRDLIVGMCFARAEALRKKVRYDNLQSLLDAKRSEGALERAKIEKGIFHSGR